MGLYVLPPERHLVYIIYLVDLVYMIQELKTLLTSRRCQLVRQLPDLLYSHNASLTVNHIVDRLSTDLVDPTDRSFLG